MKSYKTKKMNLQLFAGETVTDLTGYTWTPNATIEFPSVVTYSINYNIVCANTEYNSTGGTSLIFMTRSFKTYTLYNLDIDTNNSSFFGGSIYTQTGTIFEGIDSSTMSDTRNYGPSYVTEIQFTGGDDATNASDKFSALLSWLEANGTLTAPQPTGYSSTINLTNCTCNKSSESGLSGSYSATITANEGYYLSSVTSTLGTVTIAENKKTATIEISDVNADFTITATGTAKTIQNVVLHPNNNGTTDYTTDLLPKASGGGNVTSVNGQTGVVVLDTDDISDTNSNNKFVTSAQRSQITTNSANITSLQSSKQNTITSNNKLSADLIDDTNTTNKLVTATEKTQISTNTTDITNLQTSKQDTIDSSHKVSADYISNGTNNKVFTATEQTKLSNIESGAQVNTVTSVNTKTGAVVLDADDISDTNTNNKFVTASDKNAWDGKSVVIANPTLAGTESDLTGLQIDGTKYKVPTGSGSAGVSSLGGATGDITLGTGLSINNNVLSASGGGSLPNINLIEATLNTTYVASGKIQYVEIGNVVFVYFQELKLKSGTPTNDALIASNLPKFDTSTTNETWPGLVFQLNDMNIMPSGRTALRLALTNSSSYGVIKTLYSADVTSGDTAVCGTLIYQKLVEV